MTHRFHAGIPLLHTKPETLFYADAPIMENPASSPGPQHVVFVNWAECHGVQIDGCKAASIPGRGLGVVACRQIEVLIFVLLVCSLDLIYR